MARIFITGANTGLGYETARQLKGLGHELIVGARSAEKGACAARELGVDWVEIDVTSDASVEAAAAILGQRYGVIDVLVNNAGIAGGRIAVEEYTAARMEAVLQTNFLGAVRTTTALYPLLSKSACPVIVNVSSGLGSFAVTSDPERLESRIVTPAYSASKAALNMYTTSCAKAWPAFRVNAVDPRSTKTGLMGGVGMQEVAQGVIPIVAMATIGPDGPTGTFVDRDGAVAW